MCFGGGGQAPDNSAQIRMQEEQMKLQREQMAMQQEQAATQQAQYREQLAISKAPPPPAPNEGAMAAASAIETMDQATAQSMRAGTGRRKLRTDLPQMTTLAIPGAA
jgi:hypothetical protein